jgi:hypothetical protein
MGRVGPKSAYMVPPPSTAEQGSPSALGHPAIPHPPSMAGRAGGGKRAVPLWPIPLWPAR